MNKDQGVHLLDTTFNAPFDEQRFTRFINELLNDVNTGKGFEYGASPIKNTFQDHVNKFRRLGGYQDPEGNSVDILVVQLKNEWALERSRTMLRNFTADYLKNRNEKDAALVAYYTTDPDDWRFSYVRMDYTLEATESGKIKVREQLTPARRYSYLVGENEPNHTAQSQLLDILVEDNTNPTLSQLESAFSVDAVSKQFYLEYRSHYERLKEELDDILELDEKIAQEFESQTIETSNFAKKLMGQIVFLYFIQKKGWLGVGKDENGNFKSWGTGPKDFMKRLFVNKDDKYVEYSNFFNDVLEPLFYHALAHEHDDDYYPALDCKIPFLNGGLFEPINDYNWKETDILIDNNLLKDVFTTFDQYNFTVREDEPLEKEVAIDPEMLGKVFENLIEENEKKGKGTYYTPRPIVHYMCQESLINYLYTEVNKDPISYQEIGDDQLDVLGNTPTKIQPTIQVEHKEEPVPKEDIEALIHEGHIILELERVSKEDAQNNSALLESIKNNAHKLDEALASIKVCDPAIGSGAFPVGMLNEIVKARDILEELYLNQKQSTYDFKRHCIQESIYGVDIDSGAVEIAKLRLWLSLVVDEIDYNQIQPLPNLDYKIMQGNSLIEEFRDISLTIKKKQVDLFSGGSELDTLIEELHRKQNDFFNAEHPKDRKSKREAVESVILKIFHNELENKKNISAQESTEIESELKQMTHGNKERNFFPWNLYFADVFREKGGFDVVIANPPYVDIKKLPADLTKKLFDNYKTTTNRINLYSVFIELSMKVINESGFVSFINPNSILMNSSYERLRHSIVDEVEKIIKLPDSIFENAIVETILLFIKRNSISPFVLGAYYHNVDTISFDNLIFNQYNKTLWKEDDSLRFNIFIDGRLSTIIKKLTNSNSKSRINDHFLFSLGITPYDKYRGHSKELIKSRQFHSPVKLDNNYKPLISGKNIKSYYVEDNIVEYLNYGDWLGAPRKEAFFLRPRIIVRQIVSGNDMCIFAGFTDKPLYHTQIGFSIIENDHSKLSIKYLLSLINSSLIKFYHKFKFLDYEKKTFQKILIENCKKFPIPNIKESYQKPFINLVDQILTAKKINPEADTTALETEIDQLVYKLYDLKDDEIAIVEESVGG